MSKFSTTAKLVEPAHQQIFAKQKSAGLKTWILAISTALAVLGTAPFAQAAIVKGTISGTWGQSGYGDSFTANYSYDDTTITPYTVASYYNSSGFSAVLSSLRVTSGSYDHTFDFTPGVRNGTFEFTDYALAAPYTPYSYQGAQVIAFDTLGSESNLFRAYRYAGQYNGSPDLNVHAAAQTFNNNGFVTRSAYTTSNVNFSPDPTAVTAVPTPGLLAGLAAFGRGVWRKRKQAKQVEV